MSAALEDPPRQRPRQQWFNQRWFNQRWFSQRWSGAARVVLLIILVLLLIDGLIMLADMAHRLNTTRGRFPAFDNLQWQASRDGSAAELFGYLQLSVAAVLLSWLHLKLRPPTSTYVALAAIMVLIVIDDAFQLHEQGGKRLFLALDLAPRLGLRPQDIGELLVWAGLGVMLGTWLLISVVRSRPRERRAVCAIALASSLLVFSAVVVDMVYIMVRDSIGRRGAYLIRWTEAAGELVGTTLILAVVCHLVLRERRDRVDGPLRPAPG